MKLWRVRIQDSQLGDCLSWHPSQRSARAAIRELKRVYDVLDERIESVEVPADKPGLLRWLNANLRHDNG